MELEYSVDWFSNNIPKWEKYLFHLKDKQISCLEIGLYEGRSAFYTLKNLLLNSKSKLTCVDRIENNFFLKNKQKVDIDNKINYVITPSWNFLKKCNKKYDFIYIDGCHWGASIIEDAVLSWRLLKNNGILIFDDYRWNKEKNDSTNPKETIDFFIKAYQNQLEVLEISYQVYIKKISEKYPV